MQTSRTEHDDTMPEPTPLSMAVGAFMVQVEGKMPGITRLALESLEDEQAQASILRLRGPRMTSTTRKALAGGIWWLGLIALVAEGAHGKPAKKRVR